MSDTSPFNKPRKWIDYDRNRDGNPFYFVLREAARRRDQLEAESRPSTFFYEDRQVKTS